MGEKNTTKKGRPSQYNKKLAVKICRQITMGDSLRKICRKKEFPSRDSVCRWLAENADFSDQYTRACAVRALVCADDILDIADSKQKPAVKRIRIDTRKWMAAKMQPKVYGDKVEVEHKGAIATFVQLDDIRQKPANE